VHLQPVAATEWVVPHTAGAILPTVVVVDDTGETRNPQIDHDDPAPGTCTLRFSEAVAGTAYFAVFQQTAGPGGGGGGSATPPFDIATLPDAGPVVPDDLVAVSQGGTMAKVTAGALCIALMLTYTAYNAGVEPRFLTEVISVNAPYSTINDYPV
jgi:hypothetical protein